MLRRRWLWVLHTAHASTVDEPKEPVTIDGKQACVQREYRGVVAEGCIADEQDICAYRCDPKRKRSDLNKCDERHQGGSPTKRVSYRQRETPLMRERTTTVLGTR